MRHKVICVYCRWTGRRSGLQCECYDTWRMYCRPWSPGPGCPSSILYGCPHCGKRTVTVVFPTKPLNRTLKCTSNDEDLLPGLYETPRDF